MALSHDRPLAPRRRLAGAGRRRRRRGRSRCSACRRGARRSRRPAPTRPPPPSATRSAATAPRSWPAPVDLGALRIADAGDVAEPDGPEGEAAVRALVAAAARRARGSWSRSAATTARPTRVAQGVGATGLITLDAHFDLRDGVSNGSPVRRLSRTGSTRGAIVQIGIADFANSVAYARRAARLRHHRHRPRRRAAPRRRRRHGAGARGRGRGRRRHPSRHRRRRLRPLRRAGLPGQRAGRPRRVGAARARAGARHPTPGSRSADIVEVDATADAPDGRTVRLAALCVLELLAGKGVRA